MKTFVGSTGKPIVIKDLSKDELIEYIRHYKKQVALLSGGLAKKYTIEYQEKLEAIVEDLKTELKTRA